MRYRKKYSELNDDGTRLRSGICSLHNSGSRKLCFRQETAVTLLVSRGVDYGDSVEVPSVVGMTKDDALTTLGKFLNVEM